MPKKGIFKNEKSEQHHWILHIQIGLGAMALLGQTRDSWPSMAPLGHVELTKNAMALLGQSRDSWPSMTLLGHVELTKMQKLLETKSKHQNENEKQNKNKNGNSFLFSLLFLL